MLILHFYGGMYFDLYMGNMFANFEKKYCNFCIFYEYPILPVSSCLLYRNNSYLSKDINRKQDTPSFSKKYTVSQKLSDKIKLVNHWNATM